MPWYANFCKGWPRGKANPGNWIDESSNLSWNIEDKSFVGDTSACNPNQRAPNQLAGAPMTEVAPGGMFRLRYGGNGHTRGSGCLNNDPGSVNVYWKGKPETEITDIKEFTPDNLLATAGFSANSFSYPADPAVITPNQGLVDKGNWMEVTVPAGTAPGRYMLVWVWHYNNKDKWSSCFDIQVSGGAVSAAEIPASSPPPVAAAPAAAAPVVKENEQAAPAVTAAPTPAGANAPAVVVETEWSTVTQYVRNKRTHARALAA